MKKVIKIFLASSITEFEAERNDLEVFIRNMSDIYENQYDIKIKPVRCEQVDPYITDSRTQDIINESLKECDMCVILVYTRFGEFSYEEFRYAMQQFRDSAEHLPKIYVYFKQLEEGVTADDSVKKFMTELNDSLKHYYGTFKNIDTVKLRIALNFVAQKLDIANVTMDEGKLVLNGVRMDAINVQRVSEFFNSKDLQDLYASLREIEPEYYELHAKYKKGEIASDSPLFEKYSKLATKRSGLKTQIEDLENTIFDFSVRLSKDEVGGNISERQKAAYRLFENGDLEGANEVLDEEEIESDYRARKAKILARKMEELRKNAIVYIHEMKTKIDILNMLPNAYNQQDTIERIYEKLLPEAEEMGCCLEVFYDYATYIYEHLGWEDKEGRLRKALDLALQLETLYEENEKEASFEKSGYLSALTGKIYLSLVGEKESSTYIKAALACLNSADETFSVLALRNPDKFNVLLTEVFRNLGKVYELKRDFVTAEKYYVKPVKFYLQSGKLKNAKHKKALADNYAKMNTGSCYEKAMELYKELCEQDIIVYCDALRECYENYAKYCKEHKNIPFGTEACPYNVFDYIEYKNKKKNGTAEPHPFDVYEAMDINAVTYIEKAIELAKKQALIDPKKYYEILSDDYEWLCQYHLHSLQEPKGKEPRSNAAFYLEKLIELNDEKENVKKGYYEKIIKYYDGLSSFVRFNLSEEKGIPIVEDETERNKYAEISLEWKKRELFAEAEIEKETPKVNDYTFSNQCFKFAQEKLKAEDILPFLEKTVLSLWEELSQKDEASALRLLHEYFRVATRFAETSFGEEYFRKGTAFALKIGTKEAESAAVNASVQLSQIFLEKNDLKKAEEYLSVALETAKNGEYSKLLYPQISAIKMRYSYGNDDEAIERLTLLCLKYAETDSQKTYALYDLANFYKRREDYKKAAQYLTESLSFPDQASYAYESLFECYQKLGDFENAEKYGALFLNAAAEEVKKRVASGNTDPWPWLSSWESACEKRAEPYLKDGNFAKAKEILNSVLNYFSDLVNGGNKVYENTLGKVSLRLCACYEKYGAYREAAEIAELVLARSAKIEKEVETDGYDANVRRTNARSNRVFAAARLVKYYREQNDPRFESFFNEFLQILISLGERNNFSLYESLNGLDSYMQTVGYPSAATEVEICAQILKQIKNAAPEAYEYYNRICALTEKHVFSAPTLERCAESIEHYSGNVNENYREIFLRSVSLYERAASSGEKEYLETLQRAYKHVASWYVSNERDTWFLYEYLKYIQFLEGLESNENIDALLYEEYYQTFTVYYNWKEYEKADECCAKIETLLKKYLPNDFYKRKLGRLYNDWSVICLNRGMYYEQRRYLLQAETMLKTLFGGEEEKRAKLILSTVYINLGDVYVKEQNYDEGKRCYLQSFACLKDGETCGKLINRLEDRKNGYEHTLNFFLEHSAEDLQTLIAEYMEVCARLYKQDSYQLTANKYLKCFDKAITAFLTAQNLSSAKEVSARKVETAREILQKDGRNAIGLLKDALQTASETFKKVGDEEGAKEYQRQFEELNL